jgi:outer membrane protein OmpA-like peptidoglycan-associated protein
VVPGPFLVFFDWDKYDITPEAAAILDRAAEAYMQTGQSSVVIDGHTDTSGSAKYNQGLSERRANAVKAYMAGKGIAESQMTTRGFGFNRLLVDTPLGVREPQNRRAEVIFGQPTN